VSADIEEGFDLLGDPAHRLDFSHLADRSGDRDSLLQRHPGNGAEQRIKFGTGSAVAVHHAVALFETNGGGQRNGLVVGEPLLEEAAEDHQPLGVDIIPDKGKKFHFVCALSRERGHLARF